MPFKGFFKPLGTLRLLPHLDDDSQRVLDSLDRIPPFARKRAVVLFTAPASSAALTIAGSPYPQEVAETAFLVINKINTKSPLAQVPYMVAYTSTKVTPHFILIANFF